MYDASVGVPTFVSHVHNFGNMMGPAFWAVALPLRKGTSLPARPGIGTSVAIATALRVLLVDYVQQFGSRFKVDIGICALLCALREHHHHGAWLDFSVSSRRGYHPIGDCGARANWVDGSKTRPVGVMRGAKLHALRGGITHARLSTMCVRMLQSLS